MISQIMEGMPKTMPTRKFTKLRLKYTKKLNKAVKPTNNKE